jgi:predicted ATP-dependent endonuclease of OLD family
VILVEGETEFFTLPIYFSACGFDLLRDGVEIINCRGKGNISRNYRLFSAYGYDSYCIFDADEKKVSNKELATIFGFNTESMKNTASSFVDGDKYGYFGIDYENYLRVTCKDYSEQEAKIQASKPLKAKIISENNKFCPPFITMIAKQMGLTNYNTVSDFVDE